MVWVVLLVSAALEAVWATALGESDGFSRALPTAVFVVGLVLSMATLGWVTRQVPISVAYAIWAGLGAALTVAWAMLTGTESVSVVKVVLLSGIVLCVVGLKLLKAPTAPAPDEAAHP